MFTFDTFRKTSKNMGCYIKVLLGFIIYLQKVSISNKLQ